MNSCTEEPFAGARFVLRQCVEREAGPVRAGVTPKIERAAFTLYRPDEIGRRPVATLELLRRHSVSASLATTTVEIFDPRLRRARLGTQLYERALKLACESGMALSSGSMRSEFAEAFWRKQVRKGRARCERSPGKSKLVGSYYRIPRAELLELGLTAAQIKDAIRKLPKPKRDADGERIWPCPRFVVKAALCREAAPSLAVLRSRRRACAAACGR